MLNFYQEASYDERRTDQASPDRNRVDGIVYSALPLIHVGQVVKNFWFKFEKGKVVDYDAEVGAHFR